MLKKEKPFSLFCLFTYYKFGILRETDELVMLPSIDVRVAVSRTQSQCDIVTDSFWFRCTRSNGSVAKRSVNRLVTFNCIQNLLLFGK